MHCHLSTRLQGTCFWRGTCFFIKFTSSLHCTTLNQIITPSDNGNHACADCLSFCISDFLSITLCNKTRDRSGLVTNLICCVI